MMRMTLLASCLVGTLAIAGAQAQPLTLDDSQLDNVTAGFVFNTKLRFRTTVDITGFANVDGQTSIALADAQSDQPNSVDAFASTQALPEEQITTSEAAASISDDNRSIRANGFARGNGSSNASTGTNAYTLLLNNVGRASASAFSAAR